MALARTVFTATVAMSVWSIIAAGCGSSSGGSGPHITIYDGGTTNSEASTGALACTPGKQDTCACPGSTVTGAQTCNTDGRSYGPCTGCPSSDAGTAGTDAGTDGGRGDAGTNADGGGRSDAGGTSTGTYDGTTGNPCTKDSDCVGTPGGPGLNKCSSSLGYNASTNTTLQPYPTPVCQMPPGATGANCNPVPPSDPSAMYIHFCDGPDVATSPGVCVPLTTPPTPGRGTCLPQCVFTLDGSPANGCVGTDTCVQIAIATTQTGQPIGLGYCQGTCETDSDCASLGTNFVCQTDTGFCTTRRITRTKAVGAACTANDLSTGACNCMLNGTIGYCTSACIVGGAPCAGGWTCETFQPAAFDLGGGATVVIASENAGLSGLCARPCGPSDAGAGSCPPNSTCQSTTVAGPDCLP